MTDEFDPQRYALSQMSEEQKDEMLIGLISQQEATLGLAIEQHNAFQILAASLSDGDTFGKRGETMRSVAFRMQIVVAIVRKNLGVDDAQIETDSAFDDIVSRLDMDEGDD